MRVAVGQFSGHDVPLWIFGGFDVVYPSTSLYEHIKLCISDRLKRRCASARYQYRRAK
jgi:hypothetical protein